MAGTRTQIDADANKGDKLLLLLVAVILIVGVAGYYFFAGQALYKWLILAAAVVVSAVIFLLLTASGKSLIGFGRDAKKELHKVVWPTRKDATSMTMYVVAFVFLVSIFLWLIDMFVEWGVFHLILHWR